jgi:hypothetical protein
VADHLRLERLEALVEEAGAEVLPERRVATSISSRATRPLMFGVVACGLLGSSRSGMTLTRKTPCPSAHGEKAGGGRGGEVGRSAAGGFDGDAVEASGGRFRPVSPYVGAGHRTEGAGYSRIARLFDTRNR